MTYYIIKGDASPAERKHIKHMLFDNGVKVLQYLEGLYNIAILITDEKGQVK